MALVEVKPIEKKKWHGKVGKEDFAQPITIEVLYDQNTGRYATGLTEDEAKELGGKLGLDLSDSFNPDAPHPYWSSKSARIKLPNHTYIFDTDKPTDKIKVANLKASRFVANSLKEYEEGKWLDATHVIFSEAEQMEVEATKIYKKRNAYKILMDMSPEDKKSIAMIISQKNLKKQSDSYVEVELEKIIETNIDKFLLLATSDKTKLATTSLILEAVQKGILNKDGSSYYYMDDQLGFDLESTVAYFEDAKNQKLKISLLEKINN